MNKLNWSNIPIPEGHVTLLVVGVVLHLWRPLRLFQTAWPRHVLGWPLLLIGIWLVAWAVAAVKAVDIQKPTKLITAGPYAISRNPMYIAWTIIYLAAAILVNTWWLIILLPVLILFTHYFVVRHEERKLELQFGEQYRQYCARVRRYLWRERQLVKKEKP
jgi:protein-S-isoprenylcysteine O-methyltransferase Ste14